MINEVMDRSRKQLGELATMQHKVNESEKLILKRAEARLGEVNHKIREIRPQAMDQSDEYLELIRERGHLAIVIAHARAAIN